MMQCASGGGDREIEREMATAATAKESTLKIMDGKGHLKIKMNKTIQAMHTIIPYHWANCNNC